MSPELARRAHLAAANQCDGERAARFLEYAALKQKKMETESLLREYWEATTVSERNLIKRRIAFAWHLMSEDLELAEHHRLMGS